MYVSAGYLPICKPFCAIDLLASKAVALASYARVASIRLVISVTVLTFGKE